MLMWLAEYLTQFESGFRAFQYLTLRGILAAGTALAISLLVGPTVINRLAFHQVGQAVREDGPVLIFLGALLVVGTRFERATCAL